MKIAILCTAVLALLQAFLGLAVSACRWKYRVSSGCPEDPKHLMYRIRTAYTNCCEWHPVLIALMVLSAWNLANAWVLWLYQGVVAARCLLIAGLTTAPLHKPNMMRFLGAAATYLLVIILSVLLITNLSIHR